MTIKRNSKRVEKERIDNIISRIENRIILPMKEKGHNAFLLQWFTLEFQGTELHYNSTGIIMNDWDKRKNTILRNIMKKENFHKFIIEFDSGDFIFTSK